MKKSKDLPMHVQFFLPIIDALKQLGGSGSPSEVKDKLIELLSISEEELQEVYKTGVSKIDNQITWSRVYLERSSLVDTSDKNVWSLTEKGVKTNLREEDVLDIFKDIHGKFVSDKRKPKKKPEAEPPPAEGLQHKEELLSTLQVLSLASRL